MSTPANIKLTIAYDGTHFLGWQKTKAGLSIEETLENALNLILKEEVFLQAASRTDAGVHAEGQVVNLFTTKDVSSYRLNQLLPKSIRILSVENENPAFHPTLDCVSKEYHYRVSNVKLQLPQHRLLRWHVPKALDISVMQEAIPYFLGEQDFSWLCNQTLNRTYSSYQCHLQAITILEEEPGEFLIIITGNRFLYKMARNIVGTLTYIGMGKLTLPNIRTLIEKKDRKLAGPTAPAHGLYLHKVFYDK